MITTVIYIALILTLILGPYIYFTIRKINQLERENERLRTWLKKYEGRQQKIALTRPEKYMILNALECSQYKGLIQEPRTKRFIRIIYNTLREKIKGSIPEYGG